MKLYYRMSVSKTYQNAPKSIVVMISKDDVKTDLTNLRIQVNLTKLFVLVRKNKYLCTNKRKKYREKNKEEKEEHRTDAYR